MYNFSNCILEKVYPDPAFNLKFTDVKKVSHLFDLYQRIYDGMRKDTGVQNNKRDVLLFIHGFGHDVKKSETFFFELHKKYDRAVALAEMLGGKAIHFDEWEQEFQNLDIIVGSTGAPHAVVHAAKIAPLMGHRADRPLFCIDLAVPRDFEPAVNEVEGVYLYDIDALQGIAEQSMEIRRQELVRCEEMIERHVSEFGQWLAAPHHDGMSPSLRPHAEGAK